MTQPAAARITEIDISRPSRALAVLRLSDYTLVVVCGFGLLGVLTELGRSVVTRQWDEFFGLAAMAAAFAYAAYTGWRHVGVIDPRVWRAYLWVFPSLVVVAAFIGLSVGSAVTSPDQVFENIESLLSLAVVLQFAGIAIPGFVCVWLLRRTRIEPMGIALGDLLSDLTGRGGVSALSATRVERTGTRRGLGYGLAGAAVLLGTTLAPLPAEGQQASTVLRVTEQLNILGFFFIVRARRYFQVSADSLLAVDKRPPILFLRSFADDEQQKYGTSRRALLDFSLETRLANHFLRFGPFIAIGSPKEPVPQPGAARVLLPDDQWQPRVLGWMRESSLIIMYCGTTQWVNWELRQVIDSGRATSLILMFPELKGWRPAVRTRDIAARTELIRSVFTDTPWHEELMEFSDYADLRAMLFRADGSMIMIKSRSRSRDAYHLSALIAHQQLLDPIRIPENAAAHIAAAPRWGLRKALAATVAVVAAILAAAYAFGPTGPTRLTFKQGELYYDQPVTEEEARGVGEYLVQQQIFSDDAPSTVQLGLVQGVYRLRFVINRAHADNPLVAIQFGAMGSGIAREALGGKPIEVGLVDPMLQPIKVVPATARLPFLRGELYYTDPITVDEATQVGEQLVKTETFRDDRDTSVHLSREEGAYQLRFVVDPSRASDSKTLDVFSELTGAIAKQALGGQPIVVHLCDDEFHSLTQRRVDSPVSTRRLQ
jgi:hypothetical protein